MKNNHKGAYVKKQDIDFWFPVPKKVSNLVEICRDHYRRTTGRCPAPYQMIETAIHQHALNLAKIDDKVKEELGLDKGHIDKEIDNLV